MIVSMYPVIDSRGLAVSILLSFIHVAAISLLLHPCVFLTIPKVIRCIAPSIAN